MSNSRPILNLKPAQPQRGVALIVALMFLVVLTILGVGGVRTTIMQERMAGNSRDRNIALQSAEAGLLLGETAVSRLSEDDFNTSCTGGRCTSGSAPSWSSYDWNGGTKHQTFSLSSNALALASLNPPLAAGPKAFYELASRIKPPGNDEEKYVYRIYSHGVGINGNTEVNLASTYRP